VDLKSIVEKLDLQLLVSCLYF